MENKPLIIVKASKPLSTKKAYKCLKNFQAIHSGNALSLSSSDTLRNLPEDILEKLTVIIDELKDKVKGDETTSVESKKRSSAVLEDISNDTKPEKGDKKKKKRKKNEEQ